MFSIKRRWLDERCRTHRGSVNSGDYRNTERRSYLRETGWESETHLQRSGSASADRRVDEIPTWSINLVSASVTDASISSFQNISFLSTGQ